MPTAKAEAEYQCRALLPSVELLLSWSWRIVVINTELIRGVTDTESIQELVVATESIPAVSDTESIQELVVATESTPGVGDTESTQAIGTKLIRGGRGHGVNPTAAGDTEDTESTHRTEEGTRSQPKEEDEDTESTHRRKGTRSQPRGGWGHGVNPEADGDTESTQRQIGTRSQPRGG
ncbi:hypothetical protein BDD12DRAFT_900459 [Trichophaea hybrida]|nr:hypothetical protein BDD12DRAFT_900459 [Trichophaea hybrida]